MREPIGRRPRRTTAVVAAALIATTLLSGCAARRAFRAGEQAARTGQWERVGATSVGQGIDIEQTDRRR